ncbi:MAG: hypothetical protein KJ737_26000 [Proteobacteria bacterium]|nr:hypothetical protein [Pseudomonadota bacterium]
MIYRNFYKYIADGTIDIDSDTIKVMLCDNSYVPDISHEFKSQITGEVTGTGYTAGGATLSNKSVALDGNESKFDADDIIWGGSTLSARFAVMYASTGNDTTSPLIAVWDFGADKVTNNSAFELTWSATGILRFKAAA